MHVMHIYICMHAMYEYLHVCIYIWHAMYECMYVYIYVWHAMYECMYACDVCMHVCIYACDVLLYEYMPCIYMYACDV